MSNSALISKLSIVIPAYNEGNTIHHILDKVKAVILLNNIEKEVIIVNDCSTDHTEEAILAYSKLNPELNIQYQSTIPSSQWSIPKLIFLLFMNHRSATTAIAPNK